MLRPISLLFRITQHLGSLEMRTVGFEKHWGAGRRSSQERLPSFWKKGRVARGHMVSTKLLCPLGLHGSWQRRIQNHSALVP